MKNIELSEDYQEFIPNEDDDEVPPTRNPLTYVHGRLILESNNKWVFESYQNVFEEKDHPDLMKEFGDLYA